MTNNTPEPDVAKIRQLLLATCTPEELRRPFTPRFYGLIIFHFDA